MDLTRIDLNLLVSLDVLLTERNVTRAAERLSLSQPALSAQLKQMRAMLADPLLLPAGRNMVPTTRALELQTPLRLLLAQLTGLVSAQQPFDPATATNTFRIAATEAAQMGVCTDLVAQLRKMAPGCRLALLQPDQFKTVEQLSTGEIDIALVASQFLPTPIKKRIEILKMKQLYSETFCCVLRQDHPAAKKPLDLATFCEFDHVLVSRTGGGFVGAIDETLAALGRTRRVAISVPSFLLVPNLIAGSDLICTVPAKLAHRWRSTLHVIDAPPQISGFEVQMAWHTRNHVDRAQKWLREQITVIAEAHDGGQSQSI